MKILFIQAQADFGAATFEDEIGVEKAKAMVEKGEAIEHEEFTASVIDFGEVDPAFIAFVKNEIMDYDHSKDTNFYVLD